MASEITGYNAGRETKSSLQLVFDLKSKLGTWDKVAKKLGVTTRSIRRWRDGTRNPDKGKSKAKIKMVSKNQKIRLTKPKEIQPDQIPDKVFNRLKTDPRDFQVIIEYTISIEGGVIETRHESFLIGGLDPKGAKKQSQALANSIKKSKSQSRKQAKIKGIFLKPINPKQNG